jgi:hypothetical protein
MSWWRKLPQSLEHLSSFKIATDLFQSDKASIVTLVIVLSALLVLEEFPLILSRRISSNFDSLVLRATIVFSPGFMAIAKDSSSAFAHHVAEEFCVTAAHYIARKQHVSVEEAREELLKQSNDYFLNSPAAESFTVLSFRQYWMSKLGRYPELTRAVLAYTSLTPSEASVERLFSCVGRVLSRSRNRLLDSKLWALTFLKFNSKQESKTVHIHQEVPAEEQPQVFTTASSRALISLLDILRGGVRDPPADDDRAIESERVHIAEIDVDDDIDVEDY